MVSRSPTPEPVSPLNPTARLVVVSNRVASPGSTHAGGLAQALLTLLQRRSGTWIGWSGRISPSRAPTLSVTGRVRRLTIDLAQSEFDHYYRDYANRALWPLLHGRMDLLSYRREAFQGYLAVNQRFCEQVLRGLRPDDLLWIHDYHLIPLASMLRAHGVRNRIGFFLHTPLPEPRLLASLPKHQQLFGKLGAYDLVGLQTEADASALRDYLGTVASERPPATGVGTTIKAFPIGTDPDALASVAEAAQSHVEVRELRDSLGGKSLLIGVDRLDYSKGLPQRLHAFGRLLDLMPSLREKATLLQVTPECRGDVVDYRRLGREIQQIVGAINGHHAAPTWTPIRYVNQSYPHEVLSGFYRLARAAVVTPLRDGMNLVAKEYLACQAPEDPGVLVLSEFAGAALELGDCAVLVNPHDTEACADAMAHALAMPIDQRRNRWTQAMKRLRVGNVHSWCEEFLSALAACASGDGDRSASDCPGAGLPPAAPRPRVAANLA